MQASFIAAFVFLYGLVIGSFLNALIWRVHEGKSIAKGRSICPNCKHQLAAGDLIPLVSWLVLRGRCRYCSKPISLQYPIVELATGSLFMISYLQLQPVGLIAWLSLFVWLYTLASLIFLAVYDLKWMLLPDVVLFPALVVNVAWLIAKYLLGAAGPAALTGASLAALIAGAGFLILALAAGGKLMGVGDVKLVVLMGVLLGLKKTILALLIGFNSAALVGVVLILLKRKKRTDYIPFGPFLILGTIVAYLFGTQVVDWYLSISV